MQFHTNKRMHAQPTGGAAGAVRYSQYLRSAVLSSAFIARKHLFTLSYQSALRNSRELVMF